LFEQILRIRSPKDLNGKKVGANARVAIVGVGARAWIDRNDGDSSTIEQVQVPFGDVQKALESGRADAVSTTFSDLAAVKNIRVLGYTTDAIGPPFIGSAWYAHADWISANREVARRCAKALMDAGRWANAHQDESGHILTRYLRLTPEEVSHLNGHRPIYSERLDPSLIQPVISAAARYTIIPQVFSAGDMVADLA